MALQTSFILDAGTNLASLMDDPDIKVLMKEKPYQVIKGYAIIESLFMDSAILRFRVKFSKSKGEEVLRISEYYFVPGNEIDYITQAYNYLKTLNEFSDAIDLLEDR
ncbi:hypothetical protein [Priestia aryabhattai]|uniref:hypothetical protein n=1 Tax=Priestia aryabhattai TaxID=412384 RepID=UPI002E1AF562|nr:hypothetical protein [Priestia aryabhattai]MED4257680.1 hypothetical protein [Priestia aryabhattai]